MIGFVPVEAVSLMPEQVQYLERKLASIDDGRGVTAVSLGLAYHDHEILAVPSGWRSSATSDDSWNIYARAYRELNHTLNWLAGELCDEVGGAVEQATMEGWAHTVQHVSDYFPNCVSHRAFAEAAGIGWRGRHGLIVTPQAGPALRLATLFVPGHELQQAVAFPGCGECRACLEVCPVLHRADDYREACRRRIDRLGLEDEVCGICVRVCWERITGQHWGADC